MKWFKHHTDSYTNLKTGSIMAEYGLSAYGLWWVCVELVGQQGTDYRIDASKGWKRHLTRFAGTQDIDAWLAAFATVNLIDQEALENGDLYVPKLAEYCDDYSSRGKTTNKLRRVSEHSTDNVPLEEKRREENKKEEKPHAHLNWLTAIPEEDVKELCEKYEASKTQITRKAETMKNYCLSKGKVYKNYRAFLEGGLDKDFGRRIIIKAPEKEEPVILSAEEQARIDEKKREISTLFKAATI